LFTAGAISPVLKIEERRVLIGPVFSREAIVSPRRPRLYALRTIYGSALLLLVATAWMIITGTQVIRNLSDMARFGSLLMVILSPLQLALLMFLSAIQSASNVSIEKDRQTLILLLMTRLSNSELVLGKLFASLLSVGSMLLTALPIFLLIVLFGGSSFQQVFLTFIVTAISCLLAGSLGTLIAFWREKTFQSLALVCLILAAWIGSWEAIGWWGGDWWGISGRQLAAMASPFQAVFIACQPALNDQSWTQLLPFVIFNLVLSVLVCGFAMWRVRYWNPSRDVRPGQAESSTPFVSVFADPTGEPGAGLAAGVAMEPGVVDRGESLRAGHVDDRARVAGRQSRQVWDNPILWREMCTWAYGKKIVFVRLAYWTIAIAVLLALYSMVSSGAAFRTTAGEGVTVPVMARPLAPFLLISVVMLNALAVSSITSERDGQAIDLLRVTAITPKEFLFGKIFGVMYVAIDFIVWPFVLCSFVWWWGGLTLENFVYLLLGLVVLDVFVVVLGIHSGMSHYSSRNAIMVSLGTVFFLFLGVVTSMVMMVSFSGNVEAQLPPFLACIVGGAVGLYVALGWHNPSPALAIAAAALPMAMFYCITSLLLKDYGSVILVLAFTYGFATTAMLMPRLSEFQIAAGRVHSTDDG
jgi:ABC-type transport system involved in multi-copper enzyme maturation permease subunit